MKKARIVAREEIIGIDTDEGLMAIDGYCASMYHEFDDVKTEIEIAEELSKIYEEKIKDLFEPKITIEFESIK